MAPSVLTIDFGDRNGFWGNTTSTIDWCEYNYEVSPYIAEFWNTITNLWMIIPPLYGIWDAYKQGFEKRFLACYLSLLIIGIGSWLFHMTLNYEMQLMDEVPMVFGSAGLTYCIYQVRAPIGKLNLTLVVFLFAYCMFFLIVYLVIKNPLFHEVIYGILVCVMMALDLELTIKHYSKTNVRLFIGGMFMYLFGFCLWNLENIFCSNLRQFRQTNLPPELHFLSQLHGWWHILAGYATYIQIVSVIHHRQTYLNKKCEYQLGWIGLRVESKNLVDYKKE